MRGPKPGPGMKKLLNIFQEALCKELDMHFHVNSYKPFYKLLSDDCGHKLQEGNHLLSITKFEVIESEQ